MNIQKISISKLNKATYNPRIELQPNDSEYQNIKRSIERFGYITPIIANKDLTVIGGHQRLSVMKDLGYTEVSVVLLDISVEDEKALNIALNKVKGEWDEAKLTEILQELAHQNLAEVTGFTTAEIDNLIEFMGIDEEELEDPDLEIEEVEDERVRKEREEDENPSKKGLLARSFIAPPRTTIDEGAEYMQARRDQWESMERVRYELLSTWFTPKESSAFYTNDEEVRYTLEQLGHTSKVDDLEFALINDEYGDLDEYEIEKVAEHIKAGHFVCVITEDKPLKSIVRNIKRAAKKNGLSLYNELIFVKETKETQTEDGIMPQQHRTAMIFTKGNITTEQIRSWRELQVKEVDEE